MKLPPAKSCSTLPQRLLALALVIAFVGVHIAHQHFQHSLGSQSTQISSAVGPRQQSEAIGHSQAANACPVCSLLGHLTLAKQNAVSYQAPQIIPSLRNVGPGLQRPCQIIASLPSPRAPPAAIV